MFGLSRLLSLHKLGVVDEAILVPVIGGQDRVNHVDELVIPEDLGLRDGLATARVVVGLVW